MTKPRLLALTLTILVRVAFGTAILDRRVLAAVVRIAAVVRALVVVVAIERIEFTGALYTGADLTHSPIDKGTLTSLRNSWIPSAMHSKAWLLGPTGGLSVAGKSGTRFRA